MGDVKTERRRMNAVPARDGKPVPYDMKCGVIETVGDGSPVPCTHYQYGISSLEIVGAISRIARRTAP